MRPIRSVVIVVVILIAAIVVARVWRTPAGKAEMPFTRALPAEPQSSAISSALAVAGHAAVVPSDTVPDSVATAAGVPGASDTAGCGDGLWAHVYHPARLMVKQNCVTVTGVIVDATAELKHPRADGVRKEADGDTHGWLKVDPEFANLINAGNRSDEGGNLVFEFVCHWRPSQADARPACQDYQDDVALPPVGAHVSITGTLVLDTNHGRWNEIHPVSKIEQR